MARSRARKSKHHPLIVAGAAVAAVGVAALLWEKYKPSSSAATTVVQGATLPASAGGTAAQSHGDATTPETVDPLIGT